MRRPAAAASPRPKGGAKAASSNATPNKIAKPVMKAMKAAKLEPVKMPTLKYPGVPKKAQPPVLYKQWKIYVSMGRQVWRTLKQGERVDQQFSFAHDPKTSWANLVKHVMKG
eukprot:8820581-Pyramimonas_sp.AAC.1